MNPVAGTGCVASPGCHAGKYRRSSLGAHSEGKIPVQPITGARPPSQPFRAA